MIKRLINGARRKILYGGDPRLYVLKRMPKGAVCAEIGVWKGDFSRSILEVTEPKELHLVDPWTFQDEYPDRMYGGKVAKSQRDMDAIYESVRSRFSSEDAVRLHRGSSREVMKKFDSEMFDWIYVDGNHYYDHVLEDLRMSYEKLKPGGVIVGDDYKWGKDLQYPVMRAVARFMDECEKAGPLRVYGSQFLIKTGV